jgi:hypothetical protein
MDIEETIEFVLDAKTQEEQEFFSFVRAFVLQKKQEEVIRSKRF